MRRKRKPTNIYMQEIERLYEKHRDPNSRLVDTSDNSPFVQDLAQFYHDNPPPDQDLKNARTTIQRWREVNTVKSGDKGQTSLFQEESLMPQGDGSVVRMAEADRPQLDRWFGKVTQEHRDSVNAYLIKADYHASRWPAFQDNDRLLDVEERDFGYVAPEEDGEDSDDADTQ